jgi:hypothetical protein
VNLIDATMLSQRIMVTYVYVQIVIGVTTNIGVGVMQMKGLDYVPLSTVLDTNISHI